MSKFSREIDRIMTVEEAADKAREMGLDENVTKLILEQFRYGNEWGPENEEIVRDNGRYGMGQSWDSFYSELAEAMGVEGDTWPSEEFIKEHPEVERVWSAFFDE